MSEFTPEQTQVLEQFVKCDGSNPHELKKAIDNIKRQFGGRLPDAARMAESHEVRVTVIKAMLAPKKATPSGETNGPTKPADASKRSSDQPKIA